MKKLFIFGAAAIGAALIAGAAVPVENVKIPSKKLNGSPVVMSAQQTKPARIKKFADAETSLKADFTVAGTDAGLVEVASYNFDSGFDGWRVDATSHVEWSTRAKGFSAIDPTDVKSLFVEGDFRVYNREKSAAVSPAVIVPDNAELGMYVYFSLNYDTYCRLELSLSTDDFVNENIVLWNSGSETGERTAYWHPVKIDLADYAAKTVRFKLLYTYGSDDEIFKTGGYMGDFAIDGFTVSGRKAIDHIDVETGEQIQLMDITEGDIAAWRWNMPGAVPETSTDKNPVIYYTADGEYDISLTVTDTDGNTATKTAVAFVSVTGKAPVARILTPATFRLYDNRKPLVAPLAPVTFRDGSTGFPTEHSWAITGVSDDASEIFTSDEANPEVSFAYLHDQSAMLTVANTHGTSTDLVDFTVEYGGVISNHQADDKATTFDMEDWGVFPGSNTRKITAYAEKFSKPSRPVMVTGAYVFFNRAEADDLVDQLSSVGVHLYTSKDGKPDRRIDSWWWSVYELDTPAAGGETPGTPFPFNYAPFVDDEFFVVVDGIPAYKEATADAGRTLVSFLMAPFRSQGNTALMLKDDQWIEAADYFPAGSNHTSFYIIPQVYHSVMAPLTNDTGLITVGKEGGQTDFQIFSYLGRKENADIDCDWVKLLSAPGEYTVDTLKIAVDPLPATMTERTGHITLTDGASQLHLTVNQNSTSGVASVTVASALQIVRNGDIIEITGAEAGSDITVYSAAGTMMAQTAADAQGHATVDISAWPTNLYVVVAGKNATKFVR